MVSQRLLDYARDHQSEVIRLMRTLVEIESPTHDRAAVNRMVAAIADEVDGEARLTRHSQSEHGDHLRIEFDIPTKGEAKILALGHTDTVWKVGTLERMPWREEGGRLWGPGVFDMKAGIVYLLFAARALRTLGLPSRCRFVVQLNADEEIGSPSSTPLTRAEARESAAVLVAEPSAGLSGKLKTARKGGATFRVEARGVAAHAGLDFEDGASAVAELARQILRITSWTDLDAGLTVNPGVVRGGTASNVVAERAWTDVDVRFRTREEALEIERRFRELEPTDPRCSVRVTGGTRKLPLERNEGVVRLFGIAREIAAEMGVSLGEAEVGGGSDGNTTAAMDIPTLDGLGAVGEGAHALHESILVDRIADRMALIAALVHRL